MTIKQSTAMPKRQSNKQPATFIMQHFEEALKGIRNPRFKAYLYQALEKAHKSGDTRDLDYAASLKSFPVPIEEFLESAEYLGKKGEIYPIVMEHLIEMNNGEYEEAVLTGGIGSAKTTMALLTNAYQLYKLSCHKDPHSYYGLDRSAEIVFVFQSLNATVARTVDYERFRSMIERSPYFAKKFPFNRNVTSELYLPNRIIVRPVSGQDTAAVGQNIIGGLLDEVNLMAIIESSKQNIDGGTYNQALALYNSIARRRQSRFMAGGKLPGMLCMVSSKRYPGQFTDQKELEAQRQIQEKGKSNIYVYDKRVWEIKPDAFSGGWFEVFVGDDSRRPRVVSPSYPAHPSEKPYIINVPVEYQQAFRDDIMNALREIAGVSTLAKYPFIPNVESIAKAFDTTDNILNLEEVDFSYDKLKIYPGRVQDLNQPRWVHLDLALTGDSAGFACGYVSGFKAVNRGADHFEVLPEIVFDTVLRVRPPAGGEIDLSKIRQLIYRFVEIGIPVKWITVDSFQSADTLQILKAKGYMCGRTSMDLSIVPYTLTKAALADGRVFLPEHATLKKEFGSLEYDAKKGKVDHPPNGSKDCSDAVAGVVHGLTMRREIWIQHGVSLNSIPESIKGTLEDAKAIKQGGK